MNRLSCERVIGAARSGIWTLGFEGWVLTLLLCALTGAGMGAQATTPERGDPVKGKAAFMSAGCYTCHGTVGQGGAGARLAPKPIDVKAFIAYVRSGRRGWSVSGGMPAYPSGALSDGALADIWAYLASIPAPPAASSIPLLKD